MGRLPKFTQTDACNVLLRLSEAALELGKETCKPTNFWTHQNLDYYEAETINPIFSVVLF